MTPYATFAHFRPKLSLLSIEMQHTVTFYDEPYILSCHAESRRYIIKSSCRLRYRGRKENQCKRAYCLDFLKILFGYLTKINNFAKDSILNNSNLTTLTIKRKIIMIKKFRCLVCGYIHEGETAPEECPLCHVGPDQFEEIVETEGELTWADEHKIGVAKGVDPEILKGLRDHFAGECSEVGMYLAMSRQADREGYPEIAEAFKRYAWEEAEHAAKFAELLGECVWDTKTNVEKRMLAEQGACEDKKRIATLAKQQNLDAIHDTVHEMCKDEARHGAGFQGLYKRYFK